MIGTAYMNFSYSSDSIVRCEIEISVSTFGATIKQCVLGI